MKNGIIALEEHYRSAAAERKCSELLKKHGLLSTEMSGISETEHQRKLREAMDDVDGIRFAHMDRHGIAIQVLSCVSQISEELPKKEYLSLYRMMNEEVAGISGRILQITILRVRAGLLRLHSFFPQEAGAGIWKRELKLSV